MRPTIDETMLDIAIVLARRATCRKLAVGCVLTDSHSVIVGTGYNGVPRGCVHCTEDPCPGASMPRGSDTCEAVHAEMNALLNPTASSAMYCYITHAPCLRCVKTLLNTQIQDITFLDDSTLDTRAKELWLDAGREWQRFSHD